MASDSNTKRQTPALPYLIYGDKGVVMIRYKNKRFDDYFIDPVTAVITDKNGVIQETYIHQGYYVFKGMGIHVIQMHTHSVWDILKDG